MRRGSHRRALAASQGLAVRVKRAVAPPFTGDEGCERGVGDLAPKAVVVRLAEFDGAPAGAAKGAAECEPGLWGSHFSWGGVEG